MRILVAVDGSECSLAAAAEAGRMLWPDRSIVRVLTVVDVPVAGGFSSGKDARADFEKWDQAFEQQGVAHVSRALSRFNEFNQGRTEVTSLVVNAKAKEGILDEAKAWDANLIMLGTHGYRGLERVWLGSVSSAVATHAGCSVRVVRPGRLSMDASSSPAPRILLATDGSKYSDLAVEAVAVRPWPAGTSVRVVSAIHISPRPVSSEEGIASQFYSRLEQAATEQAEATVHKALSRLREDGSGRESPLELSFEIAGGHPAEAINSIARGWNADIVFVGSQGWGGLRRFVLGSVSQAVISKAPCSVEIVRS